MNSMSPLEDTHVQRLISAVKTEKIRMVGSFLVPLFLCGFVVITCTPEGRKVQVEPRKTPPSATKPGGGSSQSDGTGDLSTDPPETDSEPPKSTPEPPKSTPPAPSSPPSSDGNPTPVSPGGGGTFDGGGGGGGGGSSTDGNDDDGKTDGDESKLSLTVSFSGSCAEFDATTLECKTP